MDSLGKLGQPDLLFIDVEDCECQLPWCLGIPRGYTWYAMQLIYNLFDVIELRGSKYHHTLLHDRSFLVTLSRHS